MNGQSTYKVVTRLAFLATAGSAPPWGESSLTARPVRTLNNTNSARYTTVRRHGFLDTIATEAFRRAGVQLRLIRVPPERGLLNANQGVEDSDLTRIAGLKKKYPNRVQLDEVLIDRVFAAFSRRQRLSAQWPERRQHSVGCIKNWTIDESAAPGGGQVTTTDQRQYEQKIRPFRDGTFAMKTPSPVPPQ